MIGARGRRRLLRGADTRSPRAPSMAAEASTPGQPHIEEGAGMQRGLERLLIVEFIGPFALTFVGAGTIIATGGQNIVAIALAHGLAIGLMVAAAGHISGGVYNPALTVALAATRQLP